MDGGRTETGGSSGEWEGRRDGGLWGETAKINGHLMDSMETKCNGGFLMYILV